MEKSFSGAAMMPVKKMSQKGNTRVISLVGINEKRNLLSMSLSPYHTSLPCPGALMPRPIITEKACDNIDIRYNAAAYM